MKVEILSPNKKLYKGDAEAITFPGKNGQFQVLKDHAPIFALLDKGEIVVDNKKIPILSGIIKVSNNQIIALVKQKKGF